MQITFDPKNKKDVAWVMEILGYDTSEEVTEPEAKSEIVYVDEPEQEGMHIEIPDEDEEEMTTDVVDAPAYTLDDINQAASQAVMTFKKKGEDIKPQLVEILKGLGVAKLSAISPGDYPEFMEKVEALTNG